MKTQSNPTPWNFQRVVRTTFLASQLIPVLLMLILIVGTLLLSGAQMGYNKPQIFAPLIPFPMFVVPAWLSVACAGIGLLTVVPFAATTKAPEAPWLLSAFAYSAGSAIASLVFAYFFPELTAEGRAPAEGIIGAHWIASIISAACIPVILIRQLQIGPEYDRLEKAKYQADHNK